METRPDLAPPARRPAADDPIANFADGAAGRGFFGDEPERFHPLLWDKATALATPASDKPEAATVVIIGGGLSGLSAAWKLRDLSPVILEGASRFGGNAKGQRWGDLSYSIGSAYLTKGAASAPHLGLLKALDLDKLWRTDDPTHDSVHLDGVVHPEFWFGGTDPKRQDDFRRAWNYFADYREKHYPDIPLGPSSSMDRQTFETLDRRSFADELQRSLGKHLHPHVEDLIHEYCWSAFGADPSELAASAGLNFLAADLGGLYVLPAGNAAIAQTLFERLRATLPAGSLRARSLVVDVVAETNRVRIRYVDERNRLRTLTAKACIVATPKFVAKRIVRDLPAAQVEAMAKLVYRSVLVASVLLAEPRKADFHDLYFIAGQPAQDVRIEAHRRPYTDVVLATFAAGGHPSRTVLNLYHGNPYDAGRTELLMPTAYETSRAKIESALPALLQTLGLKAASLRDIRLTRWGHGLVFPRPGILSAGIPERASEPFRERVFFAHQDNWALPCYETAFESGAQAAELARKVA